MILGGRNKLRSLEGGINFDPWREDQTSILGGRNILQSVWQERKNQSIWSMILLAAQEALYAMMCFHTCISRSATHFSLDFYSAHTNKQTNAVEVVRMKYKQASMLQHNCMWRFKPHRQCSDANSCIKSSEKKKQRRKDATQQRCNLQMCSAHYAERTYVCRTPFERCDK